MEIELLIEVYHGKTFSIISKSLFSQFSWLRLLFLHLKRSNQAQPRPVPEMLGISKYIDEKECYTHRT